MAAVFNPALRGVGSTLRSVGSMAASGSGGPKNQVFQDQDKLSTYGIDHQHFRY